MKSFAKLNLFLHVVSKRGSYHEIESLAVFLPDLSDEIKIKKAKENETIFVGPHSAGISLESNTVKKVLDLASQSILDKFSVTITKNIPQGAGLGGGSSNAACVLKYLSKKYSLSAEITNKIAIKVGADVPMFMYGRAACIGGIGEQILPLQTKLPKLFAVVVYPDKPINTAQVYGLGGFDFNLNLNWIPAFAGMTRGEAISSIELMPMSVQLRNKGLTKFVIPAKAGIQPELLMSIGKYAASLINFLQYTHNDLYPNSLKLLPELEPLLLELQNLPQCLLSRMTGSGSACFALFSDLKTAQRASDSLQKKFTRYSIYISRVK